MRTALAPLRSLRASFRGEHLEALGGQVEKFFGDRQVYRGRCGIDVAEEGGEVHQPAVGIDAFPVPSKQRGNSKRVAQVMQSRLRHARRYMQFQLGQEGMKSHADCPFVDAATLGVEGEHWQFGSW